MLHRHLSHATVITALSSILALAGCGKIGQVPGPNSSVKVTNGIEITPEELPAVVLLVMQDAQGGQGICTGTFVNDHQVLTAAHCVDNLDPHNPLMVIVDSYRAGSEWHHQTRARALSYVRSPNSSMSLNDGVNGFDLAVVTFPRNSSANWIQLAADSPADGTEFVIAGFGNNDNFINDQGQLDGSGSGTTLRAGSNVIASKENGLLIFAGAPGANAKLPLGAWASAGSGDSGGPLMIGNRLAGVTSGGGMAQTEEGFVAISFYVDLNSDASRSFLKSAIDTPTFP